MPSAHIKVNSSWRVPRASEGTPVLDVLRGELGLTSTKEGCREGDCGACAVLVGERIGETARYRAMPSCLLATGELRGKHLLSLEGLVEGAESGATPVMRAFLEENASQCGFCTPGFIISLTSWLAEPRVPDVAGALRAVDGNLCRCTGYAAIRRAAARLVQQFARLPIDPSERLRALVDAEVLPRSVLAFMEESADGADEREGAPTANGAAIVGGGTDFYVRNPEPEEGFAPFMTRMVPEFSGIREISEGDQAWIDVGAAVSVSDFFASPEVRRAVPGIERFETAFASTLIRNLATIGGNIANASPVADITAMLLALRARLAIAGRGIGEEARAQNETSAPLYAGTLSEGSTTRIVPLENFFLGYKKLDLRPREVIAGIRIPLNRPETVRFFSFEKASKRKNLDIAAVNTAISFCLTGGRFSDVGVSLGGVAPVPTLCHPAMEALEGQICDPSNARRLAELAREAARAARDAVNPIGDVRGSADYRRRMVHQLLLAHFVRLFESTGIAEELFP